MILRYLEIHSILMEVYVLFKIVALILAYVHKILIDRGNEFLQNGIIICPFKRTTTAQRVLHFETQHCIRALLESYNGYMLSTKYNKVHTLVTVSLIILVLVVKSIAPFLEFSFIIFSITIHKKYTRDTFCSNVMLNVSNCNIFSKSTISHLNPNALCSVLEQQASKMLRIYL